jgi:hypothetical protein
VNINYSAVRVNMTMGKTRGTKQAAYPRGWTEEEIIASANDDRWPYRLPEDVLIARALFRDGLRWKDNFDD